MPPSTVTAKLGRLTGGRSDWPLLSPPPSPTWRTVADILGAVNLDDHVTRIEDWARSTWHAWRAHHDSIKALLD